MRNLNADMDVLFALAGINNIEQEAEIDYERVLKKVYVPVEGDVVCVSDIHCLQNLGDGSIGVCAIRAARGEIRAPFDCKAGYSKAGKDQLKCTSEKGYVVRIYLISEIDIGWHLFMLWLLSL